MANEIQTQTQSTTGKKLPVLGKTTVADEVIEAELRSYEESERERLGMRKERKQWVDTMLNPKMTAKERAHVTVLISGLTVAQDFLIEGALRGLGYNVETLAVPDNGALQAGKEFGNRAQCNPTYFTVGNLVKHLIHLRDDKGMSAEDVVKNHIFLTAGACGPCRFGMYVTEYRKALRDAGFDGFRVMLFEQKGGLSQATGEGVGIELNPAFFVALIKALVCGDSVNALAYRIRPYELERGATNRATEDAKRILYKALFEGTNIFVALYQARREFAKVKVDKLRARAKVCIIGEFWAMTTEGDGNYHLQKFLEAEGAECDIQLTTAWLLYNIWETARDTRERQHLRGIDGGQYGLEGIADNDLGVAKRLATMRAAEIALRVGFQAFAQPLGLWDYHLPDMDRVAEVAHGHYSNDLRGGEGHMEVGKLIVNVVDAKAHMTLSVKPFGCMPSSGVSDGVQSLITSKFPGTIFCAVETSGDGATNFYSRVQMYMFKARIAAEQELERAYKEQGVTEAECRAFLEANPDYASPFHHAPHTHVYAGSAAMLVAEIAPLIKQTRLERLQTKARATAESLGAWAKSLPGKAQAVREKLADPEFRAAAKQDAELVRDMVRGKVADRFGPLAAELWKKAAEPTPAIGWSQEPVAAE